ncbi:MAG TPA: YkgJ family cysteine cluster protein [Desulfomicrobiaceae bacterium]|nr:YkgJ family cysteine cluster protein [Desulfomicrobiaceae bacterium]
MAVDFSPFFERYEQLVSRVDPVFNQVKEQFPDCVTCSPGCSDCCHALFDLSLVEALYLNHQFRQLKEEDRLKILPRADKADRKVYKIKKRVYQASKSEEDTEKLLEQAGRERVRCPLLKEDDTCAMYAVRPLTCRLYGLPLAIEGKAHTCGKSGFQPGVQYPTVNVDAVQQVLLDVSRDLATAINSKYPGLASTLLPVSSALLTEFTDEFLGVVEKKAEGGTKEWCLTPEQEKE